MQKNGQLSSLTASPAGEELKVSTRREAWGSLNLPGRNGEKNNPWRESGPDRLVRSYSFY
jgi:hypothetical protein